MIWMPKETDGVWMENKPTTSVAWSTWVIVVLALSVAACFGLTCLMFSLGKRIWRVVSVWATSLKMEVWNPRYVFFFLFLTDKVAKGRNSHPLCFVCRTGEPGWAESTRLTLKTVSLCILTYLVFSLVEQILNSPTIYQKFYQASPDMTIEAPGKPQQKKKKRKEKRYYGTCIDSRLQTYGSVSKGLMRMARMCAVPQTMAPPAPIMWRHLHQARRTQEGRP